MRGKQKARKEKKKTGQGVKTDLGEARALLAEYGFWIQQVAGDGNCLFRSFALQHCGDENRHSEYRKACCDYMTEHEDDFTSFFDAEEDSCESFSDYVSNMRESSQWGSQLELSALCLCYNISAVVFQAAGVHYELGMAEPHQKVVLISFHDEEHFNAVSHGSYDELLTLSEVRKRLQPRKKKVPQVVVQV